MVRGQEPYGQGTHHAVQPQPEGGVVSRCPSSGCLVLARVEPARGLADDPVPVNRHPQFEPGVTGIVLCGRPHAQPVRAAAADADQVEGLRAFGVLGCQVMLEQHERGPVPAGEHGPDRPRRLGDRGRRVGIGDDGQVAGLRTGRQPDPEAGNTLPGRAGRVAAIRFVGNQLTERRQAIGRGWRQDPRFLPAG